MKKTFTHIGYLIILCIFLFPKISKAENGQMLFSARMSGSEVVPFPSFSSGKGLITFLLSEDRKEVFIHGVFNELSGPIINCQIHYGTIDTTGPLVVDLTSLVSGNRIKGAIPVTSNLLFAYAASEELYVDITTAAYPNGELRGQLYLETDYIVPVFARAVNEVPPVSNPTAAAFGALRFSEYLTRLDYQILSTSLTSPIVSVDIHKGSKGENGPLLASFSANELSTGTITDAITVEDIFFYTIYDSAYINIKTTTNPDGEIRGALQFDWPNNGMALLTGDQETPPVNSSAKAIGYASIDLPNLDSITYGVIYSGIVPTAAHIHVGAPGVGGSVIIPLKSSPLPGLYSGRAAIKDVDVTSFMKDELYFNIHSAAHSGGEIRGQIQNNLLKSFAFDLCGDQEVPKNNINAYGAAFVTVNKSNTELNYGVQFEGLTGGVTAAHIHDGAFGANGSILLTLNDPFPDYFDFLTITGTEADKIEADEAYINLHTDANPDGEIRGQIRRTLSCAINTATIQSTLQDLSLVNTLVSDQLLIQANSDKDIDGYTFITDVTGKHLTLNETKHFVSGNNKIPVQVNMLSNGFYTINIVDDKNIMRSFKFIKQ